MVYMVLQCAVFTLWYILNKVTIKLKKNLFTLEQSFWSPRNIFEAIKGSLEGLRVRPLRI